MASRLHRRLQKDQASSSQKKKCGRVKIAEYDTEALRNSLEKYIKSVGVNSAFNLHSYQSLPVSFAARGNCLVKLHKWVTAILSVNPQGRLLVSHWFLFVFLFFVIVVIWMHSIFFPAIHQTSQAQNCGNTKDPAGSCHQISRNVQNRR